MQRKIDQLESEKQQLREGLTNQMQIKKDRITKFQQKETEKEKEKERKKCISALPVYTFL